MTNTMQSFEVLVKTSAVIRKKDGRVIDCGVISERKLALSEKIANALFPQRADEPKEKS